MSIDLNKVKNTSKKMLATFINELGYDGKTMANVNDAQVMFVDHIPTIDQLDAYRNGETPIEPLGRFLSPESAELRGFLKDKQLTDEEKDNADKCGIIIVNESCLSEYDKKDLYVTVIHEMIHANRNIRIFDAIRDGKNESAYTYNDGKFEQNTAINQYMYVDAGQDVLKGRIDKTDKTIAKYKDKTSEEIEDLDFVEGKIDSQMEKQMLIDEALVETMAQLSYNVYEDKRNGKDIDMWDEIKRVQSEYDKDEDIHTICDVILKHHDFELFNWMIHPIEYSDDIHYDFFTDYVKGNYSKIPADVIKKACAENYKKVKSGDANVASYSNSKVFEL